jgi:hypothetical protein
MVISRQPFDDAGRIRAAIDQVPDADQERLRDRPGVQIGLDLAQQPVPEFGGMFNDLACPCRATSVAKELRGCG